MDQGLIAKILAGLAVAAAVVFDWPRAIAGLAVGFAARRVGYPYVTIPAGVALVSGLGEVIYALIGRTAAMSGWGFALGCVAAGATAIGVFWLFRWIAGEVEAP